jgi:hypothetical protein
MNLGPSSSKIGMNEFSVCQVSGAVKISLANDLNWNNQNLPYDLHRPRQAAMTIVVACRRCQQYQSKQGSNPMALPNVLDDGNSGKYDMPL